jgi:hypothetical protein
MKKIVVFVFLILTACSKLETGLNFAPRVATNKIDDAFDFKSEKLSHIRKQIDANIQVAKRTISKKIVGHIEALEKLANSPNVSYDQALNFFNSLAETQNALLESFRTSGEMTLKDLSEKEIQNFKEYSDKKYKEDLELAKDKGDFLQKKKKTFVRNYELFLNGLTLEQDKILDQFLSQNFDYFKNRIAEKQRFAEEFYMKMKSEDKIIDLLLEHYAGHKLDDMADQPLKDYLKRLIEFQISLWKTATDQQKKYFKKMLAGYKEELIKMSTATTN